MKELRPDYYKNRRGRDIFWEMENRHFPYEQCIGFCRLNALKYKRRAGRKTKDSTIDKQKMETYEAELHRLQKIKKALNAVDAEWPISEVDKRDYL